MKYLLVGLVFLTLAGTDPRMSQTSSLGPEPVDLTALPTKTVDVDWLTALAAPTKTPYIWLSPTPEAGCIVSGVRFQRPCSWSTEGR